MSCKMTYILSDVGGSYSLGCGVEHVQIGHAKAMLCIGSQGARGLTAVREVQTICVVTEFAAIASPWDMAVTTKTASWQLSLT